MRFHVMCRKGDTVYMYGPFLSLEDATAFGNANLQGYEWQWRYFQYIQVS